MTKVLIIIGEAHDLVGVAELAEADIAVQLNAECSDGRTVKDRYGVTGPVKVVTA